MDIKEFTEISKSYNQYVQRVFTGCIFIANELRKENKNILNEILNFSEGLEWMTAVSNNLKINYGMNLLNEEKLKNYLVEINDALEIKDLNLVADLFEYEIAEYFKNPLLIEVDLNANK